MLNKIINLKVVTDKKELSLLPVLLNLKVRSAMVYVMTLINFSSDQNCLIYNRFLFRLNPENVFFKILYCFSFAS